MIGQVAGGSVMYQAMTSLGHAAESSYTGPIQLGKAKPGASVVVLGAGLAGMVAAVELRNAGYKVTVLEYQNRAGGRAWTLRGGDSFTELDGTTQTVGFAKGNYLNPGPWRVPHNHHAMMDLYRRYGISWTCSTRSTTTPMCTAARRLAASPSASAMSPPTSAAMCRSCWPRPPTRAPWMP
jgi:monoamine oxidase